MNNPTHPQTAPRSSEAGSGLLPALGRRPRQQSQATATAGRLLPESRLLGLGLTFIGTGAKPGSPNIGLAEIAVFSARKQAAPAALH
jgi:hypothetical protein